VTLSELGRGRRGGSVIALSAAAFALLISGCGTSGAGNPAPGAHPLPAGLTLPADASDHQREVAATYSVTGEVTFDDYRVAVYDALACMEDLGLETYSKEEPIFGLFEVNYTVKVPAEMDLPDGTTPEFDAIFFWCTETNSDFTTELYERLYQAQAQEDLFAAYRQATLSCLASNGRSVSSDATLDEIQGEVMDLVASEPDYSGPDCFVESGYRDAVAVHMVDPNGS
jgi:hypothetical protein